MSNPMRTFVKRLTANRKQFGVMVVLSLVLAGMWGRMLLQSEPRRASATTATEKKGAEADQPVGIDLMPQLPAVYLAMSDQCRRDLFTMNLQDFEKTEVVTKVAPTPKAAPEKTDEARRAELLGKLKTVKLQSTIMREKPVALMNDRLFQIGSEPVPGFTITRITQHSVFLKPAETDEEIELRMYRK